MGANKEELYHKSRIAFAELSQTKLAITEGDIRGHKQWLQEDYGVTDDKFEELVRGHIKDNRISLAEKLFKHGDVVRVTAVNI